MTNKLDTLYNDACEAFAPLIALNVALPKLVTLRQVTPCEVTGAIPRQQLVIKRVKNPAPLTTHFDKDGWVHCEAKIESWNELAALFHDEVLDGMSHWALPALATFARQMYEAADSSLDFVEIFTERGKWLMHGPGTAPVPAKYVNANSTMELHVDDLDAAAPGGFPHNLFIHLAAQHLDYPEETGRRRHSTGALFDVCFAMEKLIGRGTLAEAIDAYLLERWNIHAPSRDQEYRQAQSVLEGGIPSVNSSPDRVRQRARFAAMMEVILCAKGNAYRMPILQHYLQYVRLDIAFILKQKPSFPYKERDAFADRLHDSILTIMEVPHGVAA